MLLRYKDIHDYIRSIQGLYFIIYVSMSCFPLIHGCIGWYLVSIKFIVPLMYIKLNKYSNLQYNRVHRDLNCSTTTLEISSYSFFRQFDITLSKSKKNFDIDLVAFEIPWHLLLFDSLLWVDKFLILNESLLKVIDHFFYNL